MVHLQLTWGIYMGEKIYHIEGSVGAGATVIMGEHITNIQQMFPKTPDGESLTKQFAELIKEIGNYTISCRKRIGIKI